MSTKPIFSLSRAEHAALLASNELWTQYPTADGDYNRDIRLSLYDLATAMNQPGLSEAQIDRYYYDYFRKALAVEGFNEATIDLIIGQAYERGHSAGYSEVVCVAQGMAEFVKAVIQANK